MIKSYLKRIGVMDFLWILVAFVFGFGVKQLGMPPLVGYLLAGFVLHALGVVADQQLYTLADIGITLMLFTIGLKIDVRSLLKTEVWAVAGVHTVLWSGMLLGLFLLLPSLLMLGAFTGLFELEWTSALLIAFSLSFSSTVCVVKILEDKDELRTNHGKIAVGVLVIQDILAVIFLATATGKLPEPWALGLLLLLPLRPLFNRLLARGGHGELLPLMGFFLALGAAELFYLSGLKGDLGALLLGMLLAGLPKAQELYKSLMSFKDLFLIGFFLSIGFTALPTVDMMWAALMLTILLPAKFTLFFALFTFFRMRARNAYLAALSLMNFSEFGLIVANMAVENAWLSERWLVVIALSVSLSFVWSTLAYKIVHRVYARYRHWINYFQRRERLKDAQVEQPAGAEVLIIGMGRVGTSAYESLSSNYPDRVWGMDADEERVARYKQEGRNIILGDADDADFLVKLDLHNISLVMLSIPSVEDMLAIIDQLRNCGFHGRILTIARYDDERRRLLAAGADAAFGYHTEIGIGFAQEGQRLLAS